MSNINVFNKCAAQGDVLFLKVDKTLDDYSNIIKAKEENGVFVVAHSETGHNHEIVADNKVELYETNDPMLALLVVNEITTIEHKRSYDTHAPISFNPGIYEVRRQQEQYADEWRRAAD